MIDALKREVLEESGANIEVGRMICVALTHKEWQELSATYPLDNY